jgi:hypothetical protein
MLQLGGAAATSSPQRPRFNPLRSRFRKCNMSAAVRLPLRIAPVVTLVILTASSAFAQSDPPSDSAQQNGHVAADTVKFLAGGALGLALHESGHLVFDAIFDANPRIEPVHFGPFPFFAIEHRSDLSPRREFTVSSAGFWVQEATNEWLLTRRPNLRDEHAWLTKGLFTFNVLNSVGYAIVAFAEAGPVQRDTRGMAASLNYDERAMGAVILAPALLDAYRYFRPGTGWAIWASRITKAGSVLLVLKQTSSSRR